MKLTYFGHSCFLVEVEGKKLLFDPYITPNPLAGGIDATKIEADIILVSHAHYDHIADAVEIAKRTNAQVIANYEIINWFAKQGIENGFAMNIGGNYDFEWGSVVMTQAVHSSSFQDGIYGGLANGFLIESEEGCFFYSGDTDLTYDFEILGQYYDIDFAVLPIGDVFTMGVDKAILCAEFVRTTKIVGVHYDTFPPIAIDKNLAKEAFSEDSLELLLPNIGETIDIEIEALENEN